MLTIRLLTVLILLLLSCEIECFHYLMCTYHVKKASISSVYKHVRVICMKMPFLNKEYPLEKNFRNETNPFICQSYVARHAMESFKRRFSDYSHRLQSFPYPMQLCADMLPNASLDPIFQMRLALPASAKLGVRVLVFQVPKSTVRVKLRFYVVDDSDFI
jgi:hypothetical protein